MPETARPARPVRPAAAPWREGWESARALRGPGLVLQGAAVALVLASYFLPPVHAWCERLAAWRTEGGYVFSMLSTALCGGVLPFLYLRWNRATRAAYPWGHVLFFALFWAWKGAEVDLLYRTLGRIFGQGPAFAVVAPKVLCDQFGYTALYATPVGLLCFAWKDAGFRWAPVAADWRAGRWFARRVRPAVLAAWTVWIPVVCCVYALPAALQIPLFNVVLCFWSMLFAQLTARQNRGG